jgi:hypothetical protein
MVKTIKLYQEKFYTVTAGIIVNRPAPFTEEMIDNETIHCVPT